MDKRPVPKHTCSQEFLDLVPGHAYILTVQSVSGRLTNGSRGTGRAGTARSRRVTSPGSRPVITDCLDAAAPARVAALQADNDHSAHSLTVSWERPAGVYDGYRLQLLDEAGAVLANRTVPAERGSHRLEGLTPGRWYRVRVATMSGGVASAEATAEGQTRE